MKHSLCDYRKESYLNDLKEIEEGYKKGCEESTIKLAQLYLTESGLHYSDYELKYDYKLGLLILNSLIEKGSAEAMFVYAKAHNRIYRDGSSVRETMNPLALDLFEQASEKGHIESIRVMHEYYLYHDCFFGIFNYKKSYRYLMMLENNKNQRDYFYERLGNLYYMGRYFRKDYLKAVECYKKAYKISRSGYMAKIISGAYERNGDINLAIEWGRKND